VPRLPNVISGFKVFREFDLNAIRNQAEAPFHIAVIGDIGVGKSTLVTQLLSGLYTVRPVKPAQISEHRLNEIIVQPYSVVILVLDASRSVSPNEYHVPTKLRSYKVPLEHGREVARTSVAKLNTIPGTSRNIG
jgi:GTPase SAR1 family protein